MRPYTVVLLFCFFCLYSKVESRTFVWTGKSTTTRWSDPINWQCKDCGPGNFLPAEQDDVHISNITNDGVHTVVGVFMPARCLSLTLNGLVNFTIYSDLVVGLGGIDSSKSSIITLTKYLSSQGNVNVKGICVWKSGEAHGPGDYSFETLQASACLIYAHVNANTTLLTSLAPNPVSIQIFPNAWLDIKEMDVSYTSFISGNISVYQLNINHNLTLNGNVTQKYTHITITTPIVSFFSVNAPVIVTNIYIPPQYQVLLYSSDVNITTIVVQSDDSLLSISLGANVLIQNCPAIKIITAGNLTLYSTIAIKENIIINVIGGFLRTLPNPNNIIHIARLNVSGQATLVGNMDVDTLVLENESNLLGNVTAKNAYVSGTQNYAGSLTIGSSAIFENSYIYTLNNVTGLINNTGTCTINGYFSCSASIRGSGVWNVNGTWFVKGPCDVSGDINLKGNSVLIISDANNSYTFGDITGGSIHGSGAGIFTAKKINVNLFYDKFGLGSVKIGSLSSKNYTSVCCASKEITNINKVDYLILEGGIYNFSVQNIESDISYLKLSTGVILEFHDTDDIVTIETFDFYGGSFSSQGNNIQCKQMNLIDLIDKITPKKFLDGTLLHTDKLDWSKCQKGCGMTQWSNIESVHCVCDCTHCNGTCAPCFNDHCSPCRDGCSCGNEQKDCECGIDSVSKKYLS